MATDSAARGKFLIRSKRQRNARESVASSAATRSVCLALDLKHDWTGRGRRSRPETEISPQESLVVVEKSSCASAVPHDQQLGETHVIAWSKTEPAKDFPNATHDPYTDQCYST